MNHSAWSLFSRIITSSELLYSPPSPHEKDCAIASLKTKYKKTKKQREFLLSVFLFGLKLFSNFYNNVVYVHISVEVNGGASFYVSFA